MIRPSEDPLEGTLLAERYRLERCIGRGGMAVVYRATHTWTGRALAVKLLHAERAGMDNASARFLREARAAAAIRHPNLVEVIDVGEDDDGDMYLVLELLEGEPLDEHIERKECLNPRVALDVMVPILDALAALHRVGVIHRDVKPANIFLGLEAGRVVPKLVDLGISKSLERGNAALTGTGALMGTPAYMSPEQARGMTDVGVGADVWAAGVVLFECLTGRRPFESESITGLLHTIATERPPSILSIQPDLPRAIARAIDRALAYDAADRHQSMTAFAEALIDAAEVEGWTLDHRTSRGPRISVEPAAPAPPPAPVVDDGVTRSLEVGAPRVDPTATPLDSLALAATRPGPTTTPIDSLELASARVDPTATPRDSLEPRPPTVGAAKPAVDSVERERTPVPDLVTGSAEAEADAEPGDAVAAEADAEADTTPETATDGLEEHASPEAAPTSQSPPHGRSTRPWAGATVIVAAAVISGWWMLGADRTNQPTVHAVVPPEGTADTPPPQTVADSGARIDEPDPVVTRTVDAGGETTPTRVRHGHAHPRPTHAPHEPVAPRAPALDVELGANHAPIIVD